MATLLVTIGGYVAWPYAQDLYFGTSRTPAPAAPVRPASANGVSGLTIARAPDGRWMATVDYAYTGQPAGAMLRLFQVVNAGASGAPINWQIGGRSAEPGIHRFTTEVFNPNVHEAYSTQQVFAQLDVAPAPPFAKVAVDQNIQWPNPVVVEVEKALAAGQADAIVQKAVDLIDTGEDRTLQQARTLLQTLLEKAPNTDAAYVELARVAMKTNWSPAGLRDAEALLGSALQVRPDSVNGKILLGYVYAHQGRFKESESLFAESAAANPPNLWLWANWGEALAMQGKLDPAIAKYREAVARPPTNNSYDRARREAYRVLLAVLEQRGDANAVEPLLKQRAEEYPKLDCHPAQYARFLVLQRADIQGAVAVLRDAPPAGCDTDSVREVQGLAYYVAWSKGTDPERAEALRQARAFLPVGPALFYALAASDASATVARQLLASGEKIGVRDNRELDALSYALRSGKTQRARRLLRLGADPLSEVGPEKMPAALIPVLTRDIDSIRVLQRAGVDYRKLRYQQTTPIEFARQQGDRKLEQALDPRLGSL